MIKATDRSYIKIPYNQLLYCSAMAILLSHVSLKNDLRASIYLHNSNDPTTFLVDYSSLNRLVVPSFLQVSYPVMNTSGNALVSEE